MLPTAAEWAQAGTGGLGLRDETLGEPSNGQLSPRPLPAHISAGAVTALGGVSQYSSLRAPCQPGHTAIPQTTHLAPKYHIKGFHKLMQTQLLGGEPLLPSRA